MNQLDCFNVVALIIILGFLLIVIFQNNIDPKPKKTTEIPQSKTLSQPDLPKDIIEAENFLSVIEEAKKNYIKFK